MFSRLLNIVGSYAGSSMVETMDLSEASLRYATSAIHAGLNKKESAIQQGVDEDSAYGQGAAQALSMVYSSGADRNAIIARLVDMYGLLDFVLQDLLTDEEYAELVEEEPLPEEQEK